MKKEIFRMLEEAGLNPQLCDTPVPVYNASVQAGVPTHPGDVTPDGTLWMPHQMAAAGMTCIISVKGESMRDAGFNPGDRVMVEYDTHIADGDIVVAMIDGEATIKSFMTDEQGDKWLVPHNPDFDAIRLTEEMMLYPMGKVVQLIKPQPRMSYHENRKVIERTRQRLKENQIPTREEVGEAIRSVAPHVTNSRLWYAAYRVLADRRVLRENAFETFVQWLAEEVPAHKHLPTAADLQRLAVLSFSKPVKYWDADNAPVTGKRYRDYCDIARRMEEEL